MTRNIFNTNRIIRSCLLPWFFLPVAAGVSSVAGAASVSSAQSAAQTRQMQAMESGGPSTIACSVGEIGVMGNRIHVLCSNASGGIRFFAASSKDTNADRYVQLATAAKSRNQKVNIHFDAKSSANPAGCLAKDCRKITAMFW